LEREIRLKNFNFIDPEGNVLAIEMDESNLREGNLLSYLK